VYQTGCAFVLHDASVVSGLIASLINAESLLRFNVRIIGVAVYRSPDAAVSPTLDLWKLRQSTSCMLSALKWWDAGRTALTNLDSCLMAEAMILGFDTQNVADERH